MPDSHITSAAAKETISKLGEPVRLDGQNPIAARFIYSLRLIAAHARMRRDPVAELTAQLGSVDVAAKSLALSQAICAAWPENIHVSRFCCCLVSHDEATIASAIEAVIERDRTCFDQTMVGLIRPDRIERLWEAASDLVIAELQSC